MDNFAAHVVPSRAPSRPSSPSLGQRYARNASVVLIGMRGVGKTTLAQIAARAFDWEVIESNEIFAQRHGTSASSYINNPSLPSTSSSKSSTFHSLKSEILSDLLTHHPSHKIIVAGAADIEDAGTRELLKAFGKNRGPVIHVTRERDAVLDYLAEERGEDREKARVTWERREGMYRDCCAWEFVSLTCEDRGVNGHGNGHGKGQGADGLDDVNCGRKEGNGMDIDVDEESPASATSASSFHPYTLRLKPVEADFIRLLRFIHGVYTNHIPLGPSSTRSYFLALTYDDVSLAIPHLDELSIGVDMWELRVDLLRSWDLTFLSFQVALLRRHSDLPILWTIRTRSQGGSYPDATSDPPNAQIISHLTAATSLALKLGVEYIDIELFYPPHILPTTLANKGNTQMLVSWHDRSGRVPWHSSEAKRIWEICVDKGADVVKMVGTARGFGDNLSAREFVNWVEKSGRMVPTMVINLGPEGKLSRILNHDLTPVSHPLMPRVSAPGQISYMESQQVLYLTGLLPSMSYYLVGAPISQSLSPIIHSTAFQCLGLPHSYQLRETTSMEDLKDMVASPTFGGASVTSPLKMMVLPLLNRISHHARAIGAVNTLIRNSQGLIGENTDWRAIKTCVARSLGPTDSVTSTTTALVLGAGGLAMAAIYAMYQLGVTRVYLFNRTAEKARNVALQFSRLDPNFRVVVLNSITPESSPIMWPMPKIIVSALPAYSAATLEERCTPHSGLFDSCGGVAMELAYEKANSTIMQIVKKRARAGEEWIGVRGMEVLMEQAFEQVKLFTGRRAPKTTIKKAVTRELERRVAVEKGESVSD